MLDMLASDILSFLFYIGCVSAHSKNVGDMIVGSLKFAFMHCTSSAAYCSSSSNMLADRTPYSELN